MTTAGSERTVVRWAVRRTSSDGKIDWYGIDHWFGSKNERMLCVVRPLAYLHAAKFDNAVVVRVTIRKKPSALARLKAAAMAYTTASPGESRTRAEYGLVVAADNYAKGTRQCK